MYEISSSDVSLNSTTINTINQNSIKSQFINQESFGQKASIQNVKELSLIGLKEFSSTHSNLPNFNKTNLDPILLNSTNSISIIPSYSIGLNSTNQNLKKELLNLTSTDPNSISSKNSKSTDLNLTNLSLTNLNPIVLSSTNQISSTDQIVLSPKNLNLKKEVLNLKHLNSLILLLPWSLRDLLINHLNKSSRLLFDNIITNEIKDEMLKENDQLISYLSNLILINLPLNGEENAYMRKKIELDEPASELECKIRIKLIDLLIWNRNLALLNNNLISDKVKLILINENNQLADSLLRLPIKRIESLEEILNLKSTKCIFEGINCLNASLKVTQDGDLNFQKDANRGLDLNKDNQIKFDVKNVPKFTDNLMVDIDVANNNQFESDLSDDAEMDQYEKLSQDEEIGSLSSDKQRSEINVVVEIDDIENFFRSKDQKTSEFFFCQGRRWFIEVKMHEQKRSDNKDKLINETYKYMGVYLHNKDETECNFPIKTEFTLKLLSQKAGMQDIVKTFKHVFRKNGSYNGCQRFLSSKKLKNHISKGYVKNNTVYVELYLKAEESDKKNCFN